MVFKDFLHLSGLLASISYSKARKDSSKNHKKMKKQQIDIIFGIHPIIELLRAKKRKVIALYTTQPTPKQWHMIQALLPSYPVEIKHVTRDALSRLAGSTDHQGVVAYAQPFALHGKPFDAQKYPSLIVLDGIQDPRNLGAIIRSASCTNTSGVLMTAKNSAPLNAIVLKASAGLAEHIPIRIVTSAELAAQELKGAGYSVYCGLFGGTDARGIEFKKPYALVIGSEGTGVSAPLKKVGSAITLPQRVPEISYNASVAAGILLFMIASQTKQI
jgi:23S rRNA (guanosine2251-2'-O)-methyltransferase